MKWRIKTKFSKTKDLIEQLLSIRDLSNEDLDSENNQLSAFDAMYGIETAVERIKQAKESGQKVVIHGDYDVDGVCATAILWDFLYRQLELDVIPFIPSRFEHGYGLTDASIAELKALDADLVITVDCGIRDNEILQQYSDLDFIITDHHTIPTDEEGNKILPTAAVSVVHPQAPDKEFPTKEICGAHVAWKLVEALNSEFNLDFDTDEYLDLVAMATVCDVMPLIKDNRVIVRTGLEKMKSTKNIGLAQLLKIGDIQDLEKYDTYHFGFNIGPRINASGRMDTAMHALKLLTTKDVGAATALAQKLQELNVERQQVTMKLLKEAEEQIQAEKDRLIPVVYGVEWPEGVVGLIAGKLTEKYYRPVIVLSQGEETAVGSVRSIEGFNVAEALDSVSDMLVRYGGHAGAAGLTIENNLIPEFIEKINDYAAQKLSAEDLEKQLDIDMILPLSTVQIAIIEQIDELAPFGNGNPKPVFGLEKLKILSTKSIGREMSHQKVLLTDKDGNKLDAIYFRAPEEVKTISSGDLVDVAGQLDINEWQGRRSPQIILKDMRVNSK